MKVADEQERCSGKTLTAAAGAAVVALLLLYGFVVTAEIPILQDEEEATSATIIHSAHGTAESGVPSSHGSLDERCVQLVAYSNFTVTPAFVDVDDAPWQPTFDLDCDGKVLVNSSAPNVVPDESRTCNLPQYGTNDCLSFIGDGDCDVGQYRAGVIEGKGRKKKKSLLKHSPNFNCSRFKFDGGDCLNPRTSPSSLSSAATTQNASGASDGGGRAPEWKRFRSAAVRLDFAAASLQADASRDATIDNTPAHSNLRSDGTDLSNDNPATTTTLMGSRRSMCMRVTTDAGSSTRPPSSTSVHLHNPVSTLTGVRGSFLQ